MIRAGTLVLSELASLSLKVAKGGNFRSDTFGGLCTDLEVLQRDDVLVPSAFYRTPRGLSAQAEPLSESYAKHVKRDSTRGA